jgi:hypothetical protein
MKKVKNIFFRANLEGSGIVNFDSPEQRFMYNGTNLTNMRTIHENTSYAKKRFYKDGDKLTYKLSISSDCLRHNIFERDIPIQSPNIINNEALLYSFIASPAALLRGYLFADEKETLKRKGPLSITNAEQTCNALSYIETFSHSGKKITDNELADNSFFKKEVVGDIKYSADGFIDLMQLQFVSCDQVFDRFSFNPDMFGIYKQFMKMRFPSFDSELGYYQIKGSNVEIPEYGFKLSNQNIVILVREMFERILSLNIRKSTSFAKTSSLEYKLVYDPIEDTMESEDGWVKIATRKDIEQIDFEVEEFYITEDLEKAKAKRIMIDEAFEAKKTEKKASKAAKAAKKTTKNKEVVTQEAVTQE